MNRMINASWLPWIFLAIWVGTALPLSIQGQEETGEIEDHRTIWDGVFTAAQARRGQRAAQSECALCHMMEVEWTFVLDRWSEQPLRNLYDRIRMTMPQGFPASLRREEYADILAYILALNNARPGDVALPSDSDDLERIFITPSPNP